MMLVTRGGASTRIKANPEATEVATVPPRRPMWFVLLGVDLYFRRTSARYCASVRGTTDNRPCRTSGESLKAGFALISASVVGAISVPALIFTLLPSTLTTVAVPTVCFSLPVW